MKRQAGGTDDCKCCGVNVVEDEERMNDCGGADFGVQNPLREDTTGKSSPTAHDLIRFAGETVSDAEGVSGAEAF